MVLRNFFYFAIFVFFRVLLVHVSFAIVQFQLQFQFQFSEMLLEIITADGETNNVVITALSTPWNSRLE